MKNTLSALTLIVGFLIALVQSCSFGSDEVHQAVSPETEIEYTLIAGEIVQQAKVALMSNLMGAISSKGAAAAVEFCNTKALSLTDSVGGKLNVKIDRVTDRPRNKKNKGNKSELGYIETYKDDLAYGRELKPKVFESNGKMIAYFPIETNGMCLQCHGSPDKDISEEVLKTLDKLYPKDKATYYGDNEIRGMWKITLNKR